MGRWPFHFPWRGRLVVFSFVACVLCALYVHFDVTSSSDTGSAAPVAENVALNSDAEPVVGDERAFIIGEGEEAVVCETRQSCSEVPLFPGERCGVFVVGDSERGEELARYLERVTAGLPRCTRGDEPGRWLLRCSLPPTGTMVADVRACDWRGAVWQPFDCSLVDPTVDEAHTCLESVALVAFGDSSLRNILNATLDIAGVDGIPRENYHDYWDSLDKEDGTNAFFLYNTRCYVPNDPTPRVFGTFCDDFRVLFQELVARMEARLAESSAVATPAQRRRLAFFVGGLYTHRSIHEYVESLAQNATFLSGVAKALGYEEAGTPTPRPLSILKSRSLVHANRSLAQQYEVNVDLKAMVDAQPEGANTEAHLLDVMQIHHAAEHLRVVDHCMCHFSGHDDRMPRGRRLGVPVDRETARILLTLLCPSL
eukprot:Opistho-1_new@53886